MKLLFIHQNFPGQYKHMAPHFAADSGNQVICLGEDKNVQRYAGNGGIPGATIIGYPTPQGAGAETHHYIRGYEGAIRRGQAVARSMIALKEKGFRPDVVCVHPGWGEGLFIKDIFPDTKVLGFQEFYYRSRGSDVGFDPEYPSNFDDAFRVRIKNSTILMSLESSDWGVSPTRWQAMQLPVAYQARTTVIHDGVDTELLRPRNDISFSIQERGLTFKPGDELITFVNRNIEPYRGCHTFIRALPELQKRRPNAHVIIVGGDGVSYGKHPTDGVSYRQKYTAEVQDKVDWSKVHFVGHLSYDAFVAMLMVSACHVYLTYPFVLSWSMIEAMSVGCLVVGSNTPPVMEVIQDGENGLLTDFFSPSQLVATIDSALSDPDRARELRRRARETAIRDYDLKTVCLPRHIQLIEDLVNDRLQPQSIEQPFWANAAGAKPVPALLKIQQQRQARLRNAGKNRR